MLVVNILLPGVGTMIASCIGEGGGGTMVIGILQLVTSVFLVGWIWAICWSANLITASKDPSRDAGMQPQAAEMHPPPPVSGGAPPPPPPMA